MRYAITTAALRDTPCIVTEIRCGDTRRGEGEAIHLLAMYQYVLAPSKSVVNIFTSTLQFTPEICAWYIEDINPVTLEAVFLCYGEPWYIEDLNEMGDLVFVKNRFFHRRGQRSKV